MGRKFIVQFLHPQNLGFEFEVFEFLLFIWIEEKLRKWSNLFLFICFEVREVALFFIFVWSRLLKIYFSIFLFSKYFFNL